MPRIPSLLSRPYSIATFCTLIINSRKVVYLSPNKLETFFPSQGRTAHGEYSKSIQFKSKDKEYVDVRTIRQITSGCICGFGVGLLFSTISRPLLIISVIIGAGIQPSISHTKI
ncbi:hypothetical protein HI914_04419 [Erysiphe necator]|nr:hypothetical protein HI914_04419 [Erysiphe necator]